MKLRGTRVMAGLAAAGVVLCGCGASQARPAAPAPSAPACPPGTPTVTSQSVGNATGVPDLLTVSIGVTTGARSAESALGDDSARANALIASLRQNGVGDADMQTSLLSIQQTYGPPPKSVFTGYQVSNEVTVKLHDLAHTGNLIDAAAKAAGDAIHVDSIAYSISDESPLARQAREAAVTQATAQARAMATGAGMHLGPLCSVTDIQPQLGYGAGGTTGSAAGSAPEFSTVPPIEAGTETISAQATTVYKVIP